MWPWPKDKNHKFRLYSILAVNSSTGSFSRNDLLWYSEKKFLGENYLTMAQQYSAEIRTLLNERYTGSLLSSDLDIMKRAILNNDSTAPSLSEAVNWFDNMTGYIDILNDIEKTVGRVSIAPSLREAVNWFDNIILTSLTTLRKLLEG